MEVVSEEVLLVEAEEEEEDLEACLLLLGTREKSRNLMRGRRELGKRVGSIASYSRAPGGEHMRIIGGGRKKNE